MGKEREGNVGSGGDDDDEEEGNDENARRSQRVSDSEPMNDVGTPITRDYWSLDSPARKE